MFTGIVSAIGTVTHAEMRGDLHVRVACPYDPSTIAIGASIACSGACMTVVERGGTAGDCWFSLTVSAESLSKTVPHMWEEGAKLNLERALKMGDELGGHIVTGHVDEVGQIVSIRDEGESKRFVIAASRAFAPFVAAKGSVTVNGVSLTVNSVDDQTNASVHFGLNIIPHTANVTTLGTLSKGDKVNLEIDMMARYLQRMQAVRA